MFADKVAVLRFEPCTDGSQIMPIPYYIDEIM